jgi:hypothetical protein
MSAGWSTALAADNNEGMDPGAVVSGYWRSLR